MKNKTVQRVLSFCLALLLCFTWNIAEPLVANAFAIELGWVTWALISFMAASGFTFAVAGGIDALKAEVDEKVDTYYQVKGIDLYQLIAQSLRFNNNNNGQPGFWFTIAAITAIREFLVWLKSDQLWEPGEEIAVARKIVTWPAKINGVDTFACTSMLEFDSTATSGSNSYDRYKIVDYGTCVEFNKTVTTWLTRDSYCSYKSTGFYQYFDTTSNNTNLRVIYTRSSVTDVYGLTTYGFFSPSNAFGVPSSDVLGLAFGLISDHPDVHYGLYDVNGYFYPMSVIRCYDRTDIQESYTITVPETIPEFDVDEDEVVEISFDAFPDDVTYQTPEEFAEAVKQQVIDTGTVPSIKTEVVTDPDADPQPSPVIPPPDQTDPDYPDVGDLGLPSLGDALKSKFPFSLPWTFGAILGIFLAPRQTPKWEVDLPAPLSTSFTIDLSPYEELGYVSRWMSDIGFAIALLFATRKFIHW